MRIEALLFVLLMLAAMIGGVLLNLEPICRDLGAVKVCY